MHGICKKHPAPFGQSLAGECGCDARRTSVAFAFPRVNRAPASFPGSERLEPALQTTAKPSLPAGKINTPQQTQIRTQMKTKHLTNHNQSFLPTLGLAGLLAASNAFASPDYVALIPNGTVISCVTCHVNADPATDGTTRNGFGLAWRNNTPNRVWNSLLASLDSDGDGFTNGQELGDPTGSWVAGNANPPGTAFNPGDATSSPPAGAPQPTIQPPSLSGTDYTLKVNSQVGYNYVVEASPTLLPATWTSLQTNAGGGLLTFTIPVTPTFPKRFFRIRAQ